MSSPSKIQPGDMLAQQLSDAAFGGEVCDGQQRRNILSPVMPDSQATTFCAKTREYLDAQVVERDFGVELLGKRGHQMSPRSVGPSRPQRDNEYGQNEQKEGKGGGHANDDGSDPGHESSIQLCSKTLANDELLILRRLLHGSVAYLLIQLTRMFPALRPSLVTLAFLGLAVAIARVRRMERSGLPHSNFKACTPSTSKRSRMCWRRTAVPSCRGAARNISTV